MMWISEWWGCYKGWF